MRLYRHLLPVACAVAVHAVTVSGGFVFDDVLLVEKDAALKDFDLRRIFFDNYWGPVRNDVNYRPLVLLTYALNHRVSSAACGFHAVNVALNALLAWAVFLVLRDLVKDESFASLAAALYAVLPIRTEAVANIVGRAELLAALGVLGAWLVTRGGTDDRKERAALAAACVFLGLCAKESTAVAWPLLLAGGLLGGRRIPWRTLALVALAGVVYAGLRQLAVGDNIRRAAEGAASVVTLVDNPLAFASPATRIANAVALLGLYAWKTALPLTLSADYSYNQLPVRDVTSAGLWAEVALVAGVFAFLPFFLRRRAPRAAFALLWFPVTFAVTANVFFPIGTIFGERLASLPSLAYPFFLAALLGAWAGSHSVRRRTACILLTLLLAAYGARSFARNLEWLDPVTLYESTARASPRSTRAQSLGAAAALLKALRTEDPALKERFFSEAHRALDRALEIYPENGRAVGRRGEVFLRQADYALSRGETEKAAQFLLRAEEAFTRAREILARNLQSEPLYLRLRAEIRTRLGKAREALEDADLYLRTLSERGAPPDPFGYHFRALARGMLAEALEREGRREEALSLLREALRDFDIAVRLRPDLPEFYNNRGYCRFKLGDLEGALADYRAGLARAREKGVEYDPLKESEWSFRRRIASLLERMGRKEEAARELEAARRIEERHRKRGP